MGKERMIKVLFIFTGGVEIAGKERMTKVSIPILVTGLHLPPRRKAVPPGKGVGKMEIIAINQSGGSGSGSAWKRHFLGKRKQ